MQDNPNPIKNISPAKSEVSLILTSSMSQIPIPIPKTKILIPTTNTPAEVIHCNLCQCKFIGVDLDLHQRDYCSAKRSLINIGQDENSNGLMSPKRAKLNLNNSSSGSVVLNTGKLLYTGGGIVSLSKINSSYNQAGLLQIAQPVLHSGGGIMTSTSTSSPMIATSATKLDLQSIIPNSVFSIPGIPTPNLSGMLTNIKSTSMPLFSLPGKRLDLSNTMTITGTQSPSPMNDSRPGKPVPFVLGMPGPYSQPSTLTSHSMSPVSSKPFLLSPPKQQQLNSTLQQQRSPNSLPTCQIKIEVSESSPTSSNDTSSNEDSKFLRPNSLPLTPGSFKVKKQIMMTSGAASLVSPETPRPRKSYALQYQNGTAYTYLVIVNFLGSFLIFF